MKFSILTSTFNRAKLLERCLISILDQTYTNWEFIIINDGSIEDYNLIKKYLSDIRIRYFEFDENKGRNHARNFALDKALETETDYITFLDDDDYFSKECLRMAYTVIRENPEYNWFLSSCVEKDGTKITRIRKYGRLDYVNDYLFGKNICGDATHFINAKCLKNIRFPTTIKNEGGWAFLLELSKSTEIFAYDFNSKVMEYQPDGVTGQRLTKQKLTKQKLTKEELPIHLDMALKCLSLRPFNSRIYKKLWKLLRLYIKLWASSVYHFTFGRYH